MHACICIQQTILRIAFPKCGFIVKHLRTHRHIYKYTICEHRFLCSCTPMNFMNTSIHFDWNEYEQVFLVYFMKYFSFLFLTTIIVNI